MKAKNSSDFPVKNSNKVPATMGNSLPLSLFGITVAHSTFPPSVHPIQIADTDLYNSIRSAMGVKDGSILLKTNQSPERFVRDKNGLILSLIRDERGKFSHCDGFQQVDIAEAIGSILDIFQDQVLTRVVQHSVQISLYITQQFNIISNIIFDLHEKDKEDDLISIKETLDQVINEICSSTRSEDMRRVYIDEMRTMARDLRRLSKYFVRRMQEVSLYQIGFRSVYGEEINSSQDIIFRIMNYRFVCQVIIDCFAQCSCLEFILGKDLTKDAENIIVKRVHLFKQNYNDAISSVWNNLKQKLIIAPPYNDLNYYANQWAQQLAINEKRNLDSYADSLFESDKTEQMAKETFEFARKTINELYIEIMPEKPKEKDLLMD